MMQGGSVAADNDESRTLRLRWWLFCSVGFIAGHALFGVIGHGFTGPHEGRPVGLSAVAHTTGLFVLGLLVFSLQRVALQAWLRISNTRIVVAALAFVTAFQLGAYAFRPPFDYVFGFPVLGIAVWISLDKLGRSKILFTSAVILSFWLGIVVMGIAVVPLIQSSGWTIDPSSTLDHALMWVIGGGVTAIVGGLASAWPLSRLLLPPSGT